MSGSELLIVLFAVLVLFGGKRLPEMARTLGRVIRDGRRMWEEAKRQLGVDLIDEPGKKNNNSSPKINDK